MAEHALPNMHGNIEVHALDIYMKKTILSCHRCLNLRIGYKQNTS